MSFHSLWTALVVTPLVAFPDVFLALRSSILGSVSIFSAQLSIVR